MRRSSSGRHMPEMYVDATPERTITRIDDVRAVEDLREWAKHDRITRIADQIKTAGYNTPFDFILDFLKFPPREDARSVREWLRGDGMASFVETCTKHPEFRTSDPLNNVVLRLARLEFTKEVQELARSPSLRRPLSEFSIDKIFDFSLDSLGCELHATAPKFMSILELVALPESPGAIANADEDSESDCESDEEPSQPTSIGTLPELPPSRRKSRSKRHAVPMALSILLYARSQKINLIPGLLRYFFHCFRTPKRVIESLHCLGVCISYKSVISCMKTVAEASAAELQKLAADLPPLFSYIDNMNSYAPVRDQRLDNRAEMLNYSVGYIGVNPYPLGQQLLLRDNPSAKLDTLCADHLLPTEGNMFIYSKLVWAGISGVLRTYCNSHLRRSDLTSYAYRDVFRLPAEATKIFTLPAYDKNEAVIDEITEVLQLVMQALGYTREQLADRTIFFHGDYLTVRNIRFVYFRRCANSARIAITRAGESIPRDYLDHFEPIAGMFHLQIAVLNLLFHVHMGDKSDVSSLAKWFVALKRDSNIFGTGKRRTIKDFRACNQLFNHVFDAHVLAIVATKLGVGSCAQLCEALERRNWRQAFGTMEEPLTNLNYVDELRTCDERDVVYENAILFIQHGLIYRDFSNALRYSDSGRIKNCLTFFMLWFQGSKFSNYASELLHLGACLNHLWDRDKREHWYRNILVNFSGSEKGFMAVDLLGEFVVREIKAWQTATVTGAGGEYLRTVMAPQVLLCSRIRDVISREIGATRHYKHSSSVSAWFDVRTVADTLLKNRVFIFTLQRSFPPKSTPHSEVRDIYSKGVEQICAGRVIDRYVEKHQRGVNNGSDPGKIAREDGTIADELELDGLDEGDDDGDEILEMIQEMMEGLL